MSDLGDDLFTEMPFKWRDRFLIHGVVNVEKQSRGGDRALDLELDHVVQALPWKLE